MIIEGSPVISNGYVIQSGAVVDPSTIISKDVDVDLYYDPVTVHVDRTAVIDIITPDKPHLIIRYAVCIFIYILILATYHWVINIFKIIPYVKYRDLLKIIDAASFLKINKIWKG